MPYSSNADLPESVRSRYSSHCQGVWRNVWNSVYEQTHDESRAFASANSRANQCQGSKTMDPTFKIFAPMLRASADTFDGRKRLHGVASSTIKDRHGDTITSSALMDMERSANENLTIFLNHKYEVPEDVAGYVESASIRSHPSDPDIRDLALDIVINETNERAIKAWEAIQAGTKLGLSIGAKIPDGGATRDRATGAFLIEHVELLETSLVGVPANPRSWVEYAVKSLGEQDAPLLKELEADELEHTDDPPEELAEQPEGDAEPESVEENLGETLVGGVLNTSPTTSNSTTTDLTNATVTISTPFASIDIDTGNRGGKTAPVDGSSQEAPPSAPENEDEDATEAETSPWAALLPVKSDALLEEDVDAALKVIEPTVIASLHNSSELLRAVTRELIDTREALRVRNEEYAALEETTKQVLTSTAEILDRLSNTPAGRRAVLREATEDFGALAQVYGEPFMRLLKRS